MHYASRPTSKAKTWSTSLDRYVNILLTFLCTQRNLTSREDRGFCRRRSWGCSRRMESYSRRRLWSRDGRYQATSNASSAGLLGRDPYRPSFPSEGDPRRQQRFPVEPRVPDFNSGRRHPTARDVSRRCHHRAPSTSLEEPEDVELQYARQRTRRR